MVNPNFRILHIQKEKINDPPKDDTTLDLFHFEYLFHFAYDPLPSIARRKKAHNSKRLFIC